ncbi:MAG: MMPL family transporter, partial [Actinomycetota bacterium]
MLEALAKWSYRHRWPMVGLWVAALIGFNVASAAGGGDYSTDFSLPGTESQAAFDLLERRFPERSGDTADIAFKAEGGVEDPSVQDRMESFFTTIEGFPHVDGVQSPYDEGGPAQISPDGTIAFATIQFDVIAGDVPVEVVEDMLAAAERVSGDGVRVELGGSVVAFAEFEEPGGTEAIGFLAAVLILVVTFGSLLAAGLPLMTAIFGIGISISMIFLFANFLNVPDFTPQLASMIGIGVGIDYALFIVTRYRQHLHEGMAPENAVVTAITTSGRAVLFAGTTVVISFLGILLMGFSFVEGVAVGGATTVLVVMLASVTLLPAVLGFVGLKIDKLHVPRLLHRQHEEGHHSMWFRWSRLVQRRPAPIAIVGFVVLLVLAIPLLSIRLGAADAGSGDTSRSSRRSYDLLSEGFGPGFNGPLLLAADLSSGGIEDLEVLQERLANEPGVAGVAPPVPNREGDTAVMSVFPTTSPQDQETNHLVHRLRNEVVPEVMQGTGTQVFVGGITASVIDFSEKNAERLPILIGVVLLLSFLLLVAVFRSVVVPLKAVIMNLLSIGAAYGVVVAIFQWGWLKDLIGVETTGPIEAWVPMMLFTILFGLSMDYEIFLLSRIREDYVRTRDNGLAVANGLAATARVITAAAAIMISVFLSFVIG